MAPIGEHRDPRWVAREQAVATSAPPVADGDASPAVPRPQLWWEIAAVACIAVFPALYTALDSDLAPVERSESWSRPWLLARSVFVAIPVLWIARRGGMSWRELGIVRPRPIDALSVTIVTTLCLGIGWLAWMLFLALQGSEPRRDPLWSPDVGSESVVGRGAAAAVVAVAAHLANGFAEELAMRGYLIARLRAATGSLGTAVLLSTAAFTSYHVYQDGFGVTSVAVFGVVAALAFLALRNLWVVALSHAFVNLWLEFMPHG